MPYERPSRSNVVVVGTASLLLFFIAALSTSTARADVSTLNKAKTQPGVQTLRVTPGLTPEQVLARPDSTILIGPDGRQTTVGDFRRLLQKREQGAAAMKQRPRLTGQVVSRSPSAAARVRAHQQWVALEIATATQIRSARGSSRSNLESSVGTKASAAIQPGVWKVNGKPQGFIVMPAGTVVIEGFGFGEGMGQVNVFGQFATGAAVLRIVEWHNDLVVALFPEGLRGFVDHDVRLQLVTRDGKIYFLNGGTFVATREEITVVENLARLVRFRSSPNWPVDFDGGVSRMNSYHTLTCAQPGVDTLTIPDPGRGFIVTGLSASWGRMDSGDGDRYGDPGSRAFFPGYGLGNWNGDTIDVHWGVWREHSSPIYVAPGHDTCLSQYSIAVTLWGPVGVSPF